MPRRTKKQENDTINGDKFFEYFLNKNDDFVELDSLLCQYEYYDTNTIFGIGRYELSADLIEKLNCSTQETRDDIHSAMKMLVRLRQMMRKCRRDTINITEMFGLWLSPDYHWNAIKKAFPDESSFSKTYRVSFQYAVKYFLHVREVMFHRPELLFGSAKRAICEFISKYKAKGNDFFESEREVYHFILYTYQHFPTFVRVLTNVYNDRQNVIAAANRAFMVYNAARPQILHDAVSELNELVLCDFDVESAKVVLENYEFVPFSNSNTAIPFKMRITFDKLTPPFKVSPEKCLKRGEDFIYESIEKFRIQSLYGDLEAAYKYCLLLGELRYSKHNLSYELLPMFDLAESKHVGAMFFLGLRCPNQSIVEKRGGEYFEVWNERRSNLIEAAAEKGHSLAVSYLERGNIDKYVYAKYEPDCQIASPDNLNKLEFEAERGDFRAMVTLIRVSNVCNRKVSYFEKLLEKVPCREAEFLLGRFLILKNTPKEMQRGAEILEKTASNGHIGALRLLTKHYYNSGEFTRAVDLWQQMMNRNWGLHFPTFEPELSANYIALAVLEECARTGSPANQLPDLFWYRDCHPINKLSDLPCILEFE